MSRWKVRTRQTTTGIDGQAGGRDIPASPAHHYPGIPGFFTEETTEAGPFIGPGFRYFRPVSS